MPGTSLINLFLPMTRSSEFLFIARPVFGRFQLTLGSKMVLERYICF